MNRHKLYGDDIMKSIHFIQCLGLILEESKENDLRLNQIYHMYTLYSIKHGQKTIKPETIRAYLRKCEKMNMLTIKGICDKEIIITTEQRKKIKKFLEENKRMSLSSFIKHNNSYMGKIKWVATKS